MARATRYLFNRFRSLAGRVRSIPRRLGAWMEGRNLRPARVVENAIAGVIGGVIVVVMIGPGKDLGARTINAVGGLLSADPSHAEASVDSLYESVESAPLWRFQPVLSWRSKGYLTEHWADFETPVMHQFPQRAARWRELDEIYGNRALDGRRVMLTAFVSEVMLREPVLGHPRLVSVSFRVQTQEDENAAWCAPQTYRRREAPKDDQFVEIEGVILARGASFVSSGGFLTGSYLLCRSVATLGSREGADAIAEIFRTEEESNLWSDPPDLSEGGRRYMLWHWDEVDPHRLHRFPSRPIRTLGIEQLSQDVRFDQGLIRVLGWVTQVVVDRSEPGMVFQQVRLSTGDENGAVWCIGTIQAPRLFSEDEAIEIVGVPIARGSADLATGGFLLETRMICPAMRRGDF